MLLNDFREKLWHQSTVVSARCGWRDVQLDNLLELLLFTWLNSFLPLQNGCRNGRGNVQVQFGEWKQINFNTFLKDFSLGNDCWELIIVLDNAWCKAGHIIMKINDQWCIYVALGGDELNGIIAWISYPIGLSGMLLPIHALPSMAL